MANELQILGKATKRFRATEPQPTDESYDITQKYPEIKTLMDKIPGLEIKIPSSSGIKPVEQKTTEATKQAEPNPLQRLGRTKKAASTLATHRWTQAKGPATPIDDFENRRGKYAKNQGLLTGDTTAPTTHSKEEYPNPLARAVANVPSSAENAIIAPANIASGLVTHPFKTAQELVGYMAHVGASAGKAGLWALANNVAPAIGPILEAKGIGPEQFVDLWAEDPIGVSGILLGGAEGLRRGAKHATGFVEGAEGAARGGVPQPGDFDMGRVSLTDPTVIEGELAKARMKKRAQPNAQENAEVTPNLQDEAALRDEAYTKLAEERAMQEATARGEYVQEAPPGEPILDPENAGPFNKVANIPRILDPNQRFRGKVNLGEERRSFMEPQPPNIRDQGLEPSRPVADIASEFPPAADLRPEPQRGSMPRLEVADRLPKNVAVGKFNELFKSLAKGTNNRGKRKKPVSLGTGPGALQDFFERRGEDGGRTAIKDIVDELRKAGLSHTQAIDEVYRQKREGTITGPQESALLREVSNSYTKDIMGELPPEESGTYSESAQADMAKFLEEGAALEAKRKAQHIKVTPAGEIPRKGKDPIKFYVADQDMPVTGHKAGGRITADILEQNGITVDAPKEGFSFGPTKDPKGGTTLGSGLGGAQDLFDNVVKLGKSHLKLGSTDFISWMDNVRRDAATSGIQLTDEYLTKVWNTPEIMGSRPQQAPNQSIPQSILNSAVKTSATDTVGQANTAAAQALFAPEVGTGPTSMQAMTVADHNLNILRDLWESDMGTKSGVNTKARKYFAALHEAATHFITSRGLSFLKARTHTAELRDIFRSGVNGRKEAKATTLRYMHDFSDLVIDDRARALDARNVAEYEALRDQLMEHYQTALDDGRTADADVVYGALEDLGVADHQVPKLEDAKRTKLLADPKIQAAIKYWHSKVGPQIENLTADLEIQKRLRGPLGLYVKFKQLDFDQAGKMQRTRPIGEFPEVEHAGASHVGAVGAKSPWNVRPGFSGSSKKATGKLRNGLAYENDVRYMLEQTYGDRLLATTKNNLREAVRRQAITTRNTNGFKPIPKTVMVGGRPEPIVGVTFESRFGPIQDTYYVPQTVADTYTATMESLKNDKLRQAWSLASSAATTQVVLLPAEAVRHGFNAVAAVVNGRFMYRHGPLAEFAESLASAATLGMSKMATALSRAYKLEGPALAEAIERYGADGALRLTGYEGTNVQRSVMIRAAEKVPGIHALKDLVFGDPGSTRGFRGMETRLRIVLGEAIREMEPDIPHNEVAAKINDAYGTYVTKLEPMLTSFFKGLDPFARAGVGLTRSGYKLLMGRGVTGKYSPIIHAQVAGTLTAIAIYNKMLDEEHKWPWEHKDYKAGDVMLLRRGDKTYRLSFADLANGLKRGAEFTGITAVGNALIRGERAPSVLASEWTRGVGNAYKNRAAPLIKAIATLTTGKSLSQSPSGDLYSTAKPAMTGSKTSPMAQRLKAVGGTAVPIAPKLSELVKTVIAPLLPKDHPKFLGTDPEKQLPDAYMGKVAYGIQDIFSFPYVPIIGSSAQAERAKGEVQRRIQNEWKDSVSSIAREALNLPTERRMDYIMGEIDGRISDEIITELGNPMLAKQAAFKSIMSILYRGPSYNTKAEVLQDINLAPKTAPPK